MEAIEIEIDEEVFLPCYRYLDDGDFDIEIFWGSRFSGKTHRIGQKMIQDCLSLPYFRCVLAKKTFESIHDAQWQVLKDIAEEWGVSHLFKFTQSPLSIRCVNGNRFIARGFDKPEKIKGIAGANYCWIEEADQLNEEDYIALSTTLRGKGGTETVKQYFSFNPEAKTPDPSDSWIFKYFFTDLQERDFTRVKEFDIDGEIVTTRIRAKHTTWRDNPFVTAQQKALLQDYLVTNPYYYQVFALGEWGQRESKNPFILALRPEHLKECTYDPVKPIYVSMDFNIDPFCFIFAHGNDKELHVFDEAAIKAGSIGSAIDYIKANYPQSIHKMIFTGDPGGNRREFSQRDNASLYTTLARGLKLRPNQLIVPAAPTHKNSREEVNYFMHHFPDLRFSPTRCPNTIFDLKTVEVDAEGGIIKANRKDNTQRADHLDAFRYMVNTFFRGWIYKHQKRR